MNISRYVNIDKFVNQYPIYIFTSPSGIQLIISASPNVEITSPGRRARGFINPCKICQIIESLSILKYKNGFKNNLMYKEIFN